MKDVRPGPGSSNPDWLIGVNGTLFFSASVGVAGRELWKSHGTDAGTVLVKDIEGFGPSFLAALGGTLFFAVEDDGATGRDELWRSDGTEEGTVVVKVIRRGTAFSPSALGPFVEVNGTLFFTADDGVHGDELWKSDGTEAGTVLVKDIRPGSSADFFGPFPLVGANGTLFFGAHDGVAGNELWKSDGTEAGTVLVKDIAPGPESSNPTMLREVDGRIVFNACDALGCEVWTSDGTESGTRRLADVQPGPISSAPRSFTPSGPLVYFTAQTAENGSELWAVPRSALFDADADGITDGSDNCPATPNADQADLDADGSGDACDADQDGDGVANAADLCPESPPDQPVGAAGCTAEELIAVRCPRRELARHGHTLSCVSQAANEAVREGLIDPADKALFVMRAARERQLDRGRER